MENKQDYNLYINDLLSKSEDELLTLLGEDILEAALQAADKSQEDFKKAGRRWYNFNKHEIHRHICVSPVVVKYVISDEHSNQINIVTSISDLVIALYGGVSAVTVSCLIVKEGLKTVCKRYNPVFN